MSAADDLKEKRSMIRHCNYCNATFEADEGDLERLCEEHREC